MIFELKIDYIFDLIFIYPCMEFLYVSDCDMLTFDM